VKLLGEQLRKEGPCRGLDIRAAKSVSRLSEFQTKDRMFAVDRRGAGGPKGKKAKAGKDGKGAPPGGREFASFAKRKRRIPWPLT
jgi:hypothetical protein